MSLSAPPGPPLPAPSSRAWKSFADIDALQVLPGDVEPGSRGLEIMKRVEIWIREALEVLCQPTELRCNVNRIKV